MLCLQQFSALGKGWKHSKIGKCESFKSHSSLLICWTWRVGEFIAWDIDSVKEEVQVIIRAAYIIVDNVSDSVEITIA